MSGKMKSNIPALFDTNILIDYLNGVALAREEIDNYKHKNISIISYMEVMVGVDNEDRSEVEKFLHSFDIVEINSEIAELAISIRKESKIKLPDAIILATSNYLKALLITRNIKDFNPNDKNIREPYQI